MNRPNPRELRACAYWLAYCLKIGWKKADVDKLETIWWKYHPPIKTSEESQK